MKVSKSTLDRIHSDILAVCAAHKISLETLQTFPKSQVWKAYHMAYGHRTWSDDHPSFTVVPRCLPYTPDTPLYPDDTNDDTLDTAIREVMRRFWPDHKQHKPMVAC